MKCTRSRDIVVVVLVLVKIENLGGHGHNELVGLQPRHRLLSLLVFSSFFSLSFILHFRIRTARSSQLRNFNSLWHVRLLLVALALLWSVAELLRIPLLDHISAWLIPSLYLPSSLSSVLTHHEALCKVHVVACFGLFQPCFFIILLFLLNVSLMKDSTYDNVLFKAFTVLFSSCFPVLLLQLLFTYYADTFLESWSLDDMFFRSYVIRDKVVHCVYPLTNTTILGVFGSFYVVSFLGVCWKAVSLAINRKLQVRICGLAVAVVSKLTTQFLCIAISAVWRPGDSAFEFFTLLALLAVVSCAIIGEGILILQPITDALIVDNAAQLPTLPSSTIRFR